MKFEHYKQHKIGYYIYYTHEANKLVNNFIFNKTTPLMYI